jgi:dipeptide/tripeptide permease
MVFLGLILIVLGTGLLKPNISTMVGNLYEKDPVARSASSSTACPSCSWQPPPPRPPAGTPAHYASQMLGLWFLSTAVGDAIGGQVGRLAEKWPQPVYFLTFGLASVAFGLGAFMFTKHIRTLMRGIH